MAFDFPDTANGLGRNSQALNAGDLRSVNIVQVGDRTRLVLNLTRVSPYDVRIDGKDVLITLVGPDEGSRRRWAWPSRRSSRRRRRSVWASVNAIRDINFRRGKDGEGRLVVDLSDPNAGIDIRQQGTSLIVDFLKTDVPEQLRRKPRRDDFGTPVSTVLTQAQGGNVRMTITPRGLGEHNAYQSDNQFVLEVKPVREDRTKLTQGSAKGVLAARSCR